MKTYELVKSKIEELNRENSYDEIERACPVFKRAIINGKLVWILQNPEETKKWAVITEEQVEELSDLYMLKKNSVSPDEDLFIFK